METTLSKEQIALRKNGIGSSDAAVALGLDPHRSPHDLWLEKTGRVDRDFDNPKMEWGRRHEATVAEKYAEVTGVGGSVEYQGGGRYLSQGTTVVHPLREWMMATPDYLVMSEDGSEIERILEIKTSWNWAEWGEEGTDEVPQHYLVQVHWQMEVLQVEKADLAVLLSGYMFRVYTIERDPILAERMVEQCESFWYDHIKKDEPPKVDHSAGCREALGLAHPNHDDLIVAASTRGCTLAAELADLNESISSLDKRRRQIQNELLAEIGDHKGIDGPFGRLTWTTRAGNVKWRKVAEEMMPPKEVVERHRGDSYRVLNTRGLV